MLKLPKGLKKKKKKSKKDQELFTEEELKQYKQKLKQQHEGEPSTEQTSPEKSNSEVRTTEENYSVAQAACASSYSEGTATTTASTTETNKTSEADDEWKRFKELTSGIDSVLHKTQDELQRIKESSFYQRVPTAVEKKKLEEEEARRQAEQKKLKEEEEERRRQEEKEANRDKLAEAVVELSESEEESEEVDDIFNTEYIDAITSGELQLTVVPDSPETEFANEGPDPFDTTYADKLIKGPDVSKRGKKIVSLGSAVEVLTGRVDSAHAVALSGAKKKPRRGIQNLLFDESIDEDTLHAIESELPVTPEPPRTLLDELEDDILDGPIDLNVPLCIDLLRKQKKEKSGEEETYGLGNTEEDPFDSSILSFSTSKRSEEHNKPLISDDILSEFDVLNTAEDDEFAELAVESLTKKQDIKVLPKVNQIAVAGIIATVDVKFTVDFELPEKVKPARPPPPARPEGFIDIDDDDLVADDPFDTDFVEQIVPKKDEDDDFDFDPRAGEEEVEKKVITNLYESTLGGLNVTNKKDLLEGSTTDLTKLEDTPIAPTQENDTKLEEEFDPFDTSGVSKIVQPKETELKFLEIELLADSNLNRSLSDPDFDPRAQEPVVVAPPVAPPTDFDPARRKSSLSLNLTSKSVGFLVPNSNLLIGDGETGKIQKPLTPYYALPEALLEKEPEDPFDTSFVPRPIPTEVELKHIEKDLLTSSNLKHSLSDPDFDPRAEDNPTAEDLLSAKDHINTKVLTPRHEVIPAGVLGIQEDIVDPFDTSIASNIKPGATELKLLENELLPSKISEPTAVLDTLTDAQELGLGDKVLTPQLSVSFSLDIAEVDPFDTSIAENLAPGKTEIKILESEFVGH